MIILATIRVKAFLVCLFLLTQLAFAQQTKPAQPSEPIDSEINSQLEEIKAKALIVKVHASLEGSQGTAWFQDLKRLTVHGLAVSLRMEGDGMLINLQLTPYRQDGEQLYLLLQAQIWFKALGSTVLQYHSTVKGIRTKMGEAVIFYPLGLKVEPDDQVISIQILVGPYQQQRTIQ